MINNSCTFIARMKKLWGMMTCQFSNDSDPVHNNPAMHFVGHIAVHLCYYNYVHDLNFDTGECKMHAISLQ